MGFSIIDKFQTLKESINSAAALADIIESDYPELAHPSTEPRPINKEFQIKRPGIYRMKNGEPAFIFGLEGITAQGCYLDILKLPIACTWELDGAVETTEVNDYSIVNCIDDLVFEDVL